MAARQERLLERETRIVFHQTSKAVAKNLIEQTHGKMIRGDFFNKAGAAGGGIYFGHTVRECTWKAEATGEKVTLKCRVQMGNPKECGWKYPGADSDPLKSEMFRHLATHKDGPFDSVILDRAATPGKETTFPVPP